MKVGQNYGEMDRRNDNSITRLVTIGFQLTSEVLNSTPDLKQILTVQ